MQIHSDIVLLFENAENASIFYDSFIPEFDSLPMKRSQWTIEHHPTSQNKLLFQISSEDETAFRATINSLLQFAHVVEESIKLVQ